MPALITIARPPRSGRRFRQEWSSTNTTVRDPEQSAYAALFVDGDGGAAQLFLQVARSPSQQERLVGDLEPDTMNLSRGNSSMPQI